ncbi:hypothetical protein AB2I13_24390 (plasmid) [Escherichia coli]
MSRSVFRTYETDRTSLSCIVMQRPENDSDAFFWFWPGVFFCLFAFLRHRKRLRGVLMVHAELW